MNLKELKKEIRQYYGITSGKIKINPNGETFTLKIGHCYADIKLPPKILREQRLNKLID